MIPDSTGPPRPADLDHCDIEPIQIPGSIQPHGVLLVLAEPGLEVLQASLNVGELLGLDSGKVLGRPVDELLGPELAGIIQGLLENRSLGRQPQFLAKGPLAADGGRRAFDATLHRSDGGVDPRT